MDATLHPRGRWLAILLSGTAFALLYPRFSPCKEKGTAEATLRKRLRAEPCWVVKEFELGPGQSTEIVFEVYDPTVIHVRALSYPRPGRKKWRKGQRPLWGPRKGYDPRPLELTLRRPDTSEAMKVRGDFPMRLSYRVPESVLATGARWRVRLLNRGTLGYAVGILRVAYKERGLYQWMQPVNPEKKDPYVYKIRLPDL